MLKCMGKGKYLGLPYLVGRSIKQNFQFVKDRMEGKAPTSSR